MKILSGNESGTSVPVIDLAPLTEGHGSLKTLGQQISTACRKFGFFYISKHGVSLALQEQLEAVSRDFFGRDEEQKMQIRMELGGKAWRGYFPVGEELTSGKPDLKEGIYFGTELPESDPRVQAGIPMHGANLYPAQLPQMKEVVEAYMDALTQLGHTLMEGIAISLNLEPSYFRDRYTDDPLCLFRIFHYPPSSRSGTADQWGVGEHTDYGVLTILKQDAVGGLQIKSHAKWIEAPYIENTFVCNIGDMLDRMTGGYYRSTPHRVQNTSGKGRFSFPFFFDPNFDAHISPIDLPANFHQADDKETRWDGASVHDFQGTYGAYILGKVGKVFPNLKR